MAEIRVSTLVKISDRKIKLKFDSFVKIKLICLTGKHRMHFMFIDRLTITVVNDWYLSY